MKPGDLLILTNSNTAAVGTYGYDYRDLTEVWVPNGSVGVYWEDPKVTGYKFCVLVNGRLLWFDQLDSRVINETR